jgi:hypothetical protein
LPDLAPRLAALPVPVVIDHMGGVRTADGVNGAGFQALQGGHAFGETRRHHHRAGRALHQEVGEGWRLLKAADRLAKGETQQLALSGQGPEQGFRLVGQKGKGAKQIEDLIRIGHGQVARMED